MQRGPQRTVWKVAATAAAAAVLTGRCRCLRSSTQVIQNRKLRNFRFNEADKSLSSALPEPRSASLRARSVRG